MAPVVLGRKFRRSWFDGYKRCGFGTACGWKGQAKECRRLASARFQVGLNVAEPKVRFVAKGPISMCGIVGAVTERRVRNILLEGLQRLEYRVMTQPAQGTGA